jgi:hypothetical protein
MHVKETAKVGPSSGFQIGRAKWASSRLQSKRAASQALATSKLMLMANRASSLAPMTSPPITATGKNELMASWTNRTAPASGPARAATTKTVAHRELATAAMTAPKDGKTCE